MAREKEGIWANEKGQRLLASKDLLFFSRFSEKAIKPCRLFLGDISPGKSKHLYVKDAAGEIDGDPLSWRDLTVSLGNMAIDGDNASLTGCFGQRAALDQSAFGEKEVQTHAQPSRRIST
jgi:hypothetical protein